MARSFDSRVSLLLLATLLATANAFGRRLTGPDDKTTVSASSTASVEADGETQTSTQTAIATDSETETETATTVAEPKRRRRTKGCSPPPAGDWLVTHNFPAAPGNDTLVAQARSILSIKEEAIPNVYSGAGSGTASNSQIPTVPVNSPFAYNMLAIFDPETCTLSGTVYSFALAFADPIRWYYDGETLSGPYVNADNGTVLFTTMARHDAYPLL